MREAGPTPPDQRPPRRHRPENRALMTPCTTSSSWLTLPADRDVPAAYVRQIVSEARRHLNRIEELAMDSNHETTDLAEHIQRVRSMLDVLSQLVLVVGEPPESVAQMAMGIVAGVRQLLGQ